MTVRADVLTYAEINDVPLDTYGWRVIQPGGYDELLNSAPVRGENLVMPGARGRRPYDPVEDQKTVSIPMLVEGEFDEDGTPAAKASAGTSAAMGALSQALRQLPPQQRACWLLREVHGRSYQEIAELVGTTPTAVRGRIARARAELAEVRQQLENRKTIERAKGILMRRTGLSEQEAYRILQRTSQDRSVPMVDVAREVLDSEPGRQPSPS